ncbi:hypothetical protein M514_09237 [Trichuris suis]|uniref:Tubulin-specific chaperone E n=1 Tax=Trichuris suis TaxID=68888 RepID=A0A085NLD2_9BILA|nr:hypothetical protein M514_09237 [Trichuris suis]
MLSAVLMLKSAMANFTSHCTPQMPAVLLGCRVRYWDARGTVKYHGTVGSLDGKWIGIDWDEVDRGKHDGSHQNVQYFKTWYILEVKVSQFHHMSPRSGSFMRPGSVQYGCSLFEAIESREYDRFNDNHSEGAVSIFVSGKDATIEERVKKLSILALDNSLVSHAGVNENLEDAFVNITDLDLSHTLVIDWKEIVLMLRLMPNLKNKLRSPIGAFEDTVCFKNITTLALSQTEYSWKEMQTLADVFPNVERLWLSYNRIDSLDDNIPFVYLRLLSLEANPLPQWKEMVIPLGSLERLETLYLGQSGLSEIAIPKVSSHRVFPMLEELDLSDNSLDDWNCFDELNKLTSLKRLIVRRNPICSSLEEATCRQFIIAKVRNLRVLNRVEVSPQERRGAEIDYLQHFAAEWHSLKKEKEEGKSGALVDFHRRHPRFRELIEIHGPPPEVVCKSDLLVDKLLTLTFTCDDSTHAVQRKIPRSMTVEKLKLLVGRLFQLDPFSVCLSYKSVNRPDVVVPMDCDLMDIAYFSIQNEDIVIVGTVGQR